MAKKKQLRDLPADTTTWSASDQKGQIAHNAETYTKHRVECWVCGKKDSERDCTLTQYAKGLYDEGWRVISSEKYQTLGIACPRCAKTPDKDR